MEPHMAMKPPAFLAKAKSGPKGKAVAVKKVPGKAAAPMGANPFAKKPKGKGAPPDFQDSEL
jgi:hypothetical protein